jgi:uncharacterized membrane protein YdcZ (DUF606 family)
MPGINGQQMIVIDRSPPSGKRTYSSPFVVYFVIQYSALFFARALSLLPAFSWMPGINGQQMIVIDRSPQSGKRTYSSPFVVYFVIQYSALFFARTLSLLPTFTWMPGINGQKMVVIDRSPPSE